MHLYPALVFIPLYFTMACSNEKTPQEDTNAPIIINYDSLYASHGVQGSFILHNLDSGQRYTYKPEGLDKGYLPASSYKIPNSLIALETGVLQSLEDTIYWDGEQRWNDDWNRDNTFRRAFQVSCVPCYQQIARKVGVERMKKLTTSANYGQLDIREENIDLFWLEGDSRITARQQADFLQHLYREELPFKKEHQRTVKQIMLIEETPGYKLYGKTGWAQPDTRNTGWFVGFFESEKGNFLFVNCVENERKPDGQNTNFQHSRREITMQILGELGM